MSETFRRSIEIAAPPERVFDYFVMLQPPSTALFRLFT